MLVGSHQFNFQPGDEVPNKVVIAQLGAVTYNNMHPPRRHNHTAEEFTKIVENFKAKGVEVVVDYEHQTLKDVEAPAAGWVTDLEFIPEIGLIATVSWTQKGHDYIAAKEYRGYSPVIIQNATDTKSGNNIDAELHSLALTNKPLHYWQQRLTKAKEGDETVEKILAILLKKLGLETGASEEAIIAALEKMDMKKDEGATQLAATAPIFEALGMPADSKIEDLKPLVAKLKAPVEAGTLDISMYVAKDEYDKTVEALAVVTMERANEKADILVAKAVSEGKITTAQSKWAKDYAMTNPDGFNEMLAATVSVVPLKRQPHVQKPAGADPAVLIATYKSEHDCTQLVATKAICKTHPHLFY